METWAWVTQFERGMIQRVSGDEHDEGAPVAPQARVGARIERRHAALGSVKDDASGLGGSSNCASRLAVKNAVGARMGGHQEFVFDAQPVAVNIHGGLVLDQPDF